MALDVECAFCGHVFRVQDASRGLRGPCPKCQREVLAEEEAQPPRANLAAPGHASDVVAVARVAASRPAPAPEPASTVDETPAPSPEITRETRTPARALPHRRRKWALVMTLCVAAVAIAVWSSVWFQSRSGRLRSAESQRSAMRGSNSRAIPAPSDVKWRVSGDRAVLVLPDCGDMAFVKIEPGTYLRGSPDSEPGRRETETQHEVTLTQAFWLGTREVTQAQWKSVMHMNPSGNTGDNLPVESVAWSDCEQFFHELDAPGLVKFRFPTEAEWEYACRAGATTAYCFGDDPALLGDYAWYSDNSRGLSQRVGLKKPNAWGLYDMHGNVWEWCQDTLSLYTDGAVRDPIGGGMARARVVRGASFVTADVEDFRCAVRSNDYYTARSATRGFRCATNSSALDDLFAVQEGKKLAPPKGLADLRRDWERAIAEKLSL